MTVLLNTSSLSNTGYVILYDHVYAVMIREKKPSCHIFALFNIFIQNMVPCSYSVIVLIGFNKINEIMDTHDKDIDVATY